MAVLKCKMCGGGLDVSEGMTVCECEYCGTKQTVTISKDENMQSLFNRANVLRMKSEFDKAEQLYERLVQNDPNDAEAHWGLILCKFGIEYVEDPATFKRIPTCHRTSFDSIIADEDYKEAIRCADAVQRSVYETEAKEIDRLQKEILALSAKEEPYDVFICYKESDNGTRTTDSVIANDIYHQLTNEGFKVFYSAITLEDKLGSAYEPCIFAALNSAKVMLAIGTKPEYFTAVWVRNEWSRFLKMMKKDRSKLLIPCYKNMDAYELPEEFAHLQAQDMSKIGFINDVVRGIKKVIIKDEPKPATAKAPVSVVEPSAKTTVNSLLKRAYIFLEDGDWKSADEYCEKVLDLDPENAEAYLGKLMAEYQVKHKEMLKDLPESFDSNNIYQKIMKFGDKIIKSEMQSYIDHINERNYLEHCEEEYLKALSIYKDKRSDEAILNKAKKMFINLGSYKDSSEYVANYDERIKEIKKANKKKSIIIISISLIVIIITIIIPIILPEIKYNYALNLLENGQYGQAVSIFEELKTYKDSAEKISEYKLKALAQSKKWTELREQASYLNIDFDTILKDNLPLNEYNQYKETFKEYEGVYVDNKKTYLSVAGTRYYYYAVRIDETNWQFTVDYIDGDLNLDKNANSKSTYKANYDFGLVGTYYLFDNNTTSQYYIIEGDNICYIDIYGNRHTAYKSQS